MDRAGFPTGFTGDDGQQHGADLLEFPEREVRHARAQGGAGVCVCVGDKCRQLLSMQRHVQSKVKGLFPQLTIIILLIIQLQMLKKEPFDAFNDLD